MRIEKVIVNFTSGKFFHITSSESKEIKYKGKKGEIMQEVLKYIEKYINDSGFRLFNISTATGINNFFLVRD